MAVLSEEQSMIRDGAKSWVQEKSPVTAFRKLRDSGANEGFDRKVWAEMAEMGWAGILIPENYGGTGLGYLTLGLVLEETGRTLTASPLISTALTATTALLLGGTEQLGETRIAPVVHMQQVRRQECFERNGPGFVPFPHDSEARKQVNAAAG